MNLKFLVAFILVVPLFAIHAEATHTTIIDGVPLIVPAYINNDRDFLACFKISNSACVPGTENFVARRYNTQYSWNEANTTIQKAGNVSGLAGVISSDTYWCARVPYGQTSISWVGEQNKVLVVGNTAAVKSPGSSQHLLELVAIVGPNATLKIDGGAAANYTALQTIVLQSDISFTAIINSIEASQISYNLSSGESVPQPHNATDFILSCSDGQNVGEKNLQTVQKTFSRGNAYVKFNSDTNDFSLKYAVGENVPMDVYLSDIVSNGPRSGDVSFVVRNPEFTIISQSAIPASGGTYKYNFTIPTDVPKGIVEFSVSGSSTGGYWLPFKALPLKLNLTSDKSNYTSGEDAQIKVNATMSYGSLSALSGTVTYPNGTSESLPLSVSQTTAVIKTSAAGKYTVNVTATSSESYTAQKSIEFNATAQVQPPVSDEFTVSPAGISKTYINSSSFIEAITLSNAALSPLNVSISTAGISFLTISSSSTVVPANSSSLINATFAVSSSVADGVHKGNITFTYSGNKTKTINVSITLSRVVSLKIKPPYLFTIFSGKNQNFTIKIENNGTSKALGVSASHTGNLSNQVIALGIASSIDPIREADAIQIDPGKEGYALYSIKVNAEGTYISSLVVNSTNGASDSKQIVVQVFADSKPEIDALKTKLSDYENRLVRGEGNAEIQLKVSQLKTMISDTESAYIVGNFGAVKDDISKATNQSQTIEQKFQQLQQPQQAQPDDETEQTSPAASTSTSAELPKFSEEPESGAGKIVFFVILGIILVIGVVVLATSIVPDENNQSSNSLLIPQR